MTTKQSSKSDRTRAVSQCIAVSIVRKWNAVTTKQRAEEAREVHYKFSATSCRNRSVQLVARNYAFYIYQLDTREMNSH